MTGQALLATPTASISGGLFMTTKPCGRKGALSAIGLELLKDFVAFGKDAHADGFRRPDCYRLSDRSRGIDGLNAEWRAGLIDRRAA
jgi:hypothetical protein